MYSITPKVPEQFAHRGIEWWWNVVQRYIFQIKEVVYCYMKVFSTSKDVLESIMAVNRPLLEKLSDKNYYPIGIFIFTSEIFKLLSSIGIHIRQGDKKKEWYNYFIITCNSCK